MFQMLNKATQPKNLNLLKKDIFDSDFRIYKLVFIKDEGSSFDLLPDELRSHIIMMNYYW